MSDKPLSSPNTDPQLLLESGPMQLRHFNPKGILRFQGRKCVTCGGEIMDHWLRNDGTMNYFCTEDGPQTSDGITDCVWDVPQDFGSANNSIGEK
jgi:hypothetical protein